LPRRYDVRAPVGKPRPARCHLHVTVPKMERSTILVIAASEAERTQGERSLGPQFVTRCRPLLAGPRHSARRRRANRRDESRPSWRRLSLERTRNCPFNEQSR
jgi:hypothetical protein